MKHVGNVEFNTMFYSPEFQSAFRHNKKEVTIKSQCSQVKTMSQYIGDMQIVQITQRVVQVMVDRLQEHGRAGRSIIKDIQLLRHIQGIAVRVGYLLPMVPCPSSFTIIMNPPKKRHEIKEGDIERIAFHCPNQTIRDMFYVAYHTGLRRDNICNMKWEWINLDSSPPTITVPGESMKGRLTTIRRDHVVPMSVTVETILRARWSKRFGPLVFPRERSHYHGYAYTTLSNGFKEAIAKAMPGKEIVWHDLRSYFITKLVESDVPIARIKDLAGHKNIQTTMGYVQTSKKSKAADIDKAFN